MLKSLLSPEANHSSVTTEAVPARMKNGEVLRDALIILADHAPQETDGKWLEELTVIVAPVLADWDVEACWTWAEWPERRVLFPSTTKQDIGIDLVARRHSDGKFIAIQCKARQLEPDGTGSGISKTEVSKFLAAAASTHFAERWLVTNGAVPLNANAMSVISMDDRPVKVVNLTADVTAQAVVGETATDSQCSHCKDPEESQTRDCMQRDAVERTVAVLREHADADSGGLPKGQARGRIILPCGTGKTRIALRIVERLAPPPECRWSCARQSPWSRNCAASSFNTPPWASVRWRCAPTGLPGMTPPKRETNSGPWTRPGTTARSARRRSKVR